MVEFLYTEDNNSFNNEDQSSEYVKHQFGYIIFIDVKYHLVFRHFIS